MLLIDEKARETAHEETMDKNRLSERLDETTVSLAASTWAVAWTAILLNSPRYRRYCQQFSTLRLSENWNTTPHAKLAISWRRPIIE